MIAVDYSEEMIKRAASRGTALEIHTAVDDAQELRLIKPDSVDRLLSTLCIHIVPDPQKVRSTPTHSGRRMTEPQALSAFMRVLKPGGAMCASVWGRPEDSSQFNLLPEALKVQAALQQAMVDAWGSRNAELRA